MDSPNLIQSGTDAAFDLGDLFTFLWQKKLRIVFTALIIFSITAYYVTKLPKMYSASSTLMLGGGGNKFSLPTSVASLTGQSDSKMDTYMEFIRSRQFMQIVVKDLVLYKVSEFLPENPPISDEQAIEYAIGVLQKQVNLTKVSDTEMLKVTVESHSAVRASDIANFIGPTFFSFQSDMSRQKADTVSAWLNKQLYEVQDNLASAEEALQDFLRINKIIDVKSQIELTRTEIAGLMQEKLISDKLISDASLTVEQLKSVRGNEKGLLQVPWILRNPMVVEMRRNIMQQEQLVTEISKRYKEKHHKFIAAQTTLETLRHNQTELIKKLQASLLQELNSYTERGKDLTDQIEEAKGRYGELGTQELQLSKFRREIESTQKLYEVFLSRLQETEILRDLGNQSEFAIVDFATEPKKPSKPRVALILAVLSVLCVAVSAGFWLILHLISDRKTRYKKLLKSIGINVLAEIPKPDKPTKKDLKKVINEHNFAFSEAIRSLRTAVLVSSKVQNSRIIAVTSIVQNDDKSNVTISLAESFCNMERTLLIDLELRTPIIGKSFGLSDDHPGITDFIARRAKFAEVLHREPNNPLHVLPGGSVPGDPMLYLSKSRLSGFINKLGVIYERLIIDTPPVNTVGDTLVISKYVDGIILVCDIEKVETEQLLEAIQRLRDSGAPLMGVVFNKVKKSRRRRSSNGFTKRLIKKLLRY
jgi:succinoglycan biosynthesis transport protein ExoP